MSPDAVCDHRVQALERRCKTSQGRLGLVKTTVSLAQSSAVVNSRGELVVYLSLTCESKQVAALVVVVASGDQASYMFLGVMQSYQLGGSRHPPSPDFCIQIFGISCAGSGLR